MLKTPNTRIPNMANLYSKGDHKDVELFSLLTTFRHSQAITGAVRNETVVANETICFMSLTKNKSKIIVPKVSIYRQKDFD